MIRFEDARDMFLGAVAAPAVAVSAIAVEAYKKYVLCSLLTEGAVSRLPKYTANHVQRAVRWVCLLRCDLPSVSSWLFCRSITTVHCMFRGK